MNPVSRRQFLARTGAGLVASGLCLDTPSLLAQVAGQRPLRDQSVTVINPRARVPVGLIIDDSTCLVNLNRFSMPQFDAAWVGENKTYQRTWKEPSEGGMDAVGI